MDLKVINKLYNTISSFKGDTLKEVAFVKKTIKDKDLLLAELTFVNEFNSKKTAIFILDKKLTTGDYKEIARKLIS